MDLALAPSSRWGLVFLNLYDPKILINHQKRMFGVSAVLVCRVFGWFYCDCKSLGCHGLESGSTFFADDSPGNEISAELF